MRIYDNKEKNVTEEKRQQTEQDSMKEMTLHLNFCKL